MTDELDTLTDDKLSKVFAVEVAGWTYHKPKPQDLKNPKPTPYVWKCAKGEWQCNPTFATDANAVMPYLEGKRWGVVKDKGKTDGIIFSFYNAYGDACGLNTVAPTFPRAACLALLRAKRESATSVLVFFDSFDSFNSRAREEKP